MARPRVLWAHNPKAQSGHYCEQYLQKGSPCEPF